VGDKVKLRVSRDAIAAKKSAEAKSE